MTEYRTNSTHEKMAERFVAADRIALITHSKPDGDAVGSTLALARACKQLGKSFHIFLIGPLAPNLAMLISDEPCTVIDRRNGESGVPRGFRAGSADTASLEPKESFDLIIITDSGASTQIEPLAAWVRDRLRDTMIFDHHVAGDLHAAMRIVEPGAASATMVIHDFLQQLPIQTTGGPFGIAEALFLGLATDTGWFQFSNADARAFRMAASLIEAGADTARVHRIIQENDRPERLAIKARALRSLEFVAGGKAAIMSLRPGDFKETRAVVEDMTAIVNEPLSVASVRVAALLTEVEPGATKVSFRSKPGFSMDHEDACEVDVNALAARFGGGGHVFAAGAKIDQPLEKARGLVIDAIEEVCKVEP